MVNKITSEEYADLIVDNNSTYALENPENLTLLNPRFSMLHVPIQEINKCSIGTFPYRLFPKCYTLESQISLEKSGITRIQNNPNIALYGQGVLIGIIDTGIDYQHEAFVNKDGTTKIISLWDQTINGDSSLSGNVKFGTEYNREMINLALTNNNPLEIVPSRDDIGHGTMLAGIIAGNESIENNFRGVVPASELIVVKLKQAKKIMREIFAISNDAICFQETDILIAANYVYAFARQLGRPIAICIGLGSSQGSHDGRGILDEYLWFIGANSGIGVVVSGGNEGNKRRHYIGIINNIINYNDFELNVGENEFGFAMEIWQSTPHRLSIEITSPTGERISPIFPSLNECRRLSFIFERTIVYVNNIISESLSGEQLILIRMEYPTSGIWKFRASNIDGLTSYFNVWLPSGDLISDNTFFLNADPNTTLTSPGNASSPITISAYNPNNDSIWLDSSRGYTRTEAIKPDMAAPGVNLVCTTINNRYGIISGTGAAAAHTTGIVAMLLEWGIVLGNYQNLSGVEIKKILIRGAKRDVGLIYPNKIWGYGSVDVFNAFDKLN